MNHNRIETVHSQSSAQLAKADSPASLADQAYLLIQERILRGELPLGTPLSRRETAREFQMSLVPISEAFQRLEADGLLESRPRVGTRVRIPTEDDILGMYVVREALESQAARLFTTRASLEERHELRRLAKQMDTLFTRAVANLDPDFVFAVNSFHLQLHMRIAEGARCPALKEGIEKKQVLIFNWIYDLWARRPVPPDFHTELAQHLTSGDEQEADAAMRSHIRFGLDELIAAIRPQTGEWRLRVKANR
ncbi:MAG TPA: GntR family transcriptional regulator [Acidobacteriota bacterium]|nr:GntR family transcriptional regulator [Acidobacteriota bacterium]